MDFRIVGRALLPFVLCMSVAAPTLASPDSLSARGVAFALRYTAPDASAHSPRSPARDRWWAMDKAKHLGGSALWTLSTQYVLVVKLDASERRALPWSVASAAAVGVAKETYDRYVGPTRLASWKDLVADAVGIALGVGVILL